MSRPFLAAAVQMNSGENKATNLSAAGALIERAAAEGARLIVLPELFNCLGHFEQMLAAAEPIPGPTSNWLAEQARRHGILLVGGSICERATEERAYNTSLVFDAAGQVLAKYRKIHLFDVDLPGQVTYRESAWLAPGEQTSVTSTALARLGLAICYDLRFGHLFAALADQDAEVLCTPSAFTETTGRDHWEVLVRARAIENQAFVVAANQRGQHTASFTTYGHSMIVDPWGVVLAKVDDDVGIALAEIDRERLLAIRARLPALAHRREIHAGD
jgi:predicted amidohydrolase